MKWIFRTVVTLALATLGWGYVYITNPANGNPLKWVSATIPVQIKLGSTPTLSDGSTYEGTVQTAMQVWNGYMGAVQFVPHIQPVGSATDNNQVNEIVLSSTVFGQSFDVNTLAVTTVWHSGNQRTEADLIFNSAWTWDSYRDGRSNHPNPGGVSPYQYKVDMQRVAIHELGHMLGLDHPDTANPRQSVTAIMNSGISDNVYTVQPDDIAGVQSLYGVPGVVPANDNFANAIAVTLNGYTAQLTGSSVNATKEAGEPNHVPNQPGGRTVWWKWVATGNGSTTVTTHGSNFDTMMAIYTGSSVSALTLIGYNDDVVPPPATGPDDPSRDRTSAVTFNAVNGTTYQIVVDGWGGESGSVALNLTFGANTVPAFTTQPQSQTVTTGYSVTFTAAASGIPSPTYRWQKNGVNIGGATSSSYTIASAAPGDAGTYRLIATNSVGSATSNDASLTVNPVTVTGTVTGDFNGDGKPDLLWQNSKTGERAIWLMNGTQFLGSSTLGIFPLEWTIAATGDFNGDGKPDIVWSNSITGERAIWLMNGTQFLASSTLGIFPLEWTIAATGDFNGDGKPDIIWSNSITGERAIWLMNGTQFLASSTLGIFPLEWTVAATGDFNGDGKPDIIWSNSKTGERAIWLMNGTQFLGSSTLGIFPLEWTVAGAADFNGDGKPDIIWSNSKTGERAIWLMNGTQFLGSSTLGMFPLEWTVKN